MTEWNLANIWEAVADRAGERTALVHGTDRTTWREFDHRSACLAAAFTALGAAPDAKVASYLYNSSAYVEGTFASFKARLVPVNVNYRYTDDELLYLLENSDTEILLFHSALADNVAAVRDRASKLRAVIQVDADAPLLDGALVFEDLIARHDPQPRTERSGADPWLLYTGGTTGMPKGVIWRQEDLFGSLAETAYPIYGAEFPPPSVDAIAEIARTIFESCRAPVHLPASPIMHGTGALTSMQSLFLGGTVVTLEGRHFDADELWSTVERERVTQMAIVGDAFSRPMVQALDAAIERGTPYDISSLALVVSSGVMWSGASKAALQAHQPVLCLDTLGSSEGVGFANQLTMPGKAATTARFKIGAHTKVLAEDGTEVEPGSGTRGLLALSGHIPSGYYKDAEKSAGTFKEFGGRKYSIPGDWATVEADGTITLLGRGSACINSGGEKVYPEEVEEALKAHPAVFDALVVGRPDERFGETVAAVVALEPDHSISVEVLLAEALPELARYKHPRHVVFSRTIRRGPNGKPDYGWARQFVEDHPES